MKEAYKVRNNVISNAVSAQCTPENAYNFFVNTLENETAAQNTGTPLFTCNNMNNCVVLLDASDAEQPGPSHRQVVTPSTSTAAATASAAEQPPS